MKYWITEEIINKNINAKFNINNKTTFINIKKNVTMVILFNWYIHIYKFK